MRTTETVPSLDAFQARCEALAILVASGATHLHDAVDRLQADAVAMGLVRAIGQDAVQAIMSDALGRDR